MFKECHSQATFYQLAIQKRLLSTWRWAHKTYINLVSTERKLVQVADNTVKVRSDEEDGKRLICVREQIKKYRSCCCPNQGFDEF